MMYATHPGILLVLLLFKSIFWLLVAIGWTIGTALRLAWIGTDLAARRLQRWLSADRADSTNVVPFRRSAR